MVIVKRQAKSRHIFDCLPIQPVEILVRGRDLRGHPFPVREVQSRYGFVEIMGALLGGPPQTPAFGDVIFAAGMPRGAGREVNLEVDASVAVDRLRVAALHSHNHGPAKVTVRIAANQLLIATPPFRFDAAFAYRFFCFDFEDVGEIGTNRDLEIEAQALTTVAPNIQVLVKPLSDHAFQDESYGPRCNFPMHGDDPGIDQVGSGRIISDRAGIQDGPGLAIDIKLIVTYVSSIMRIEALVSSIRDRPIEFGNQECVSMINGDDGWANGDFQSHTNCLQARPARATSAQGTMNPSNS